MISPITGIDIIQYFYNTITYRHFTVCFQKRIFSPDRLTAKMRDVNRGMVGKNEKSEGRTSIQGNRNYPVVRLAEPGCRSKQSSFASRCSVQGAAPLAMLRIYPCTAMKKAVWMPGCFLYGFFFLFDGLHWTMPNGYSIII